MTDDYDFGTPPKEEPDCYTCTDSGCPDCGYINPDDPEHLKAVAARIIHDRRPLPDRTVSDADLVGIPDAAHATIRELVATAQIHTEIRWPEPGGYGTEIPF